MNVCAQARIVVDAHFDEGPGPTIRRLCIASCSDHFLASKCPLPLHGHENGAACPVSAPNPVAHAPPKLSPATFGLKPVGPFVEDAPSKTRISLAEGGPDPSSEGPSVLEKEASAGKARSD